MSNQIETARQRLLDLSKRNQLLSYKEKKRTVHIINISLNTVFKTLVQDGKSITITSQDSNKPNTPHNILEKRCTTLIREARNAIEETGSNLLYLAIGFLQWYEDKIPSQAPLILIPIRLERKPHSTSYQYTLSYDETDIETNISLAKKLANDFNLILPVFSTSILPEDYLNQVTTMITKLPDWQVIPDIKLDLFSFTKILMYKDLTNEKLTDNTNIKQILATSPANKYKKLQYSESLADKIPLILDADSSQQTVIMEALQHNLVIEGPPGTGKSQTIANLIAATIAQGKSVLFVAEKKAALQVVSSRLEQAGLGDFCLELHSHKTQKTELHANLKTRLNKAYPPIQLNLKKLLAKKQKLLAYSKLMNSKVGPCNEPIYDIFWKLERLRLELANETLYLKTGLEGNFNKKVSKLKEFGEYYASLSVEVIQHWQGFQPILSGDETSIRHILTDWLSEIQAYQAYLEVLTEETQIPLTQDLTTIDVLANINADIFDSLPIPFDTLAAIKLSYQGSIEKLRKFQIDQKEYKKLLVQATKFLGHGRYSVKVLQQLLNATDKLGTLGFNDDSADEIQQVVKNFDKLDNELQELNQPESVADFLSFLKLQELAQQAPQDLVLNKHPEHALEATPIVLKHAQQQFAKLTEQWEEQKQYFLLHKLPDAKTIAIQADELRKHKGDWLAFLSSDYRQAKRTVKSFLATTKFNSRRLIKQLEILADLKQQTEQTSQYPQYQRLFGPIFMGLETDWNLLAQHVTWAQQLSIALGNPEEAQKLLLTQADPRSYILTNTSVIHARWLKVVKIAAQLHVPVDSLSLVNEFVISLLSQRNQIVKLSNLLQQHLPHLSDRHVISIHSAVQNLLTAWHLRNEVEQNQFLKKLFGKPYHGIETDVTVIVDIADWIEELKTVGNLSPALIYWLVSEDTPMRISLLQTLLSHTFQFSKFSQKMEVFGKFDIQKWLSNINTLDQLTTKIINCQASISSLPSLTTLHLLIQELDNQELNPLVMAVFNQQIQPEHAKLHFEFAVYQKIIQKLISKHNILARLTRCGHEHLRQQFIELDKKILQDTAKYIANQAAKRKIPQGNGTGRVTTLTDRSLLEHELNKKRRHIPIRQLIRRATKALQAVKPCFMMSPLSVSQYLPPGQIEFDLLIIDEASQIRPEEALGAIARCKQLVIVGDSKQLPPSQFFNRLVVNEDDTVLEGQESILDIGLGIFPNGSLQWHYRSAHESLIAFSNANFYANKLVVFPTAQIQQRVQFNYVAGTYAKGCNFKEAEAVVAAVKEHFKTNPHLSLGIATLNIRQRDLIRDLLDKKGLQVDKSFFIKNLENVQGDERDAIFISITYGPDVETGRIFQRFGPINNDDGWRRLNVLFTRAKQRLILFSSLRSADIQPSSRRGVKILKSYLQYAETGQLTQVVNRNTEVNDFEVVISKILHEHGYQTVFQIAGIDVGVLHPERENEYILGIEYDGVYYHSAKSIRERERLRTEILASKGWKIHRIWSVDWFKNRETEINRLLQALSEEDKSIKVESLSR
ncbi:DUF4011 domain-containing protein [Candidatus Halobeggiatoa sp. HSG11]|nr:DUF4011 domain-containing protein [Candidatus Halobeggiatoa sp. HSG11]